MSTKSELLAAYASTIYRVFLPEQQVDLKLGVPSAELDSWLQHVGADCYWIVTAYNPRSLPAVAAVNAARQDELLARVRALKLPVVIGVNVAASGDWPDEPTILVAGLKSAEALVLASEFEQNAVVCGVQGGVPQLCWIQEET